MSPTTPTAASDATSASCWFLYLLECADGTVYAGITTDMTRRFAQHQAGTGARYTRSHPPTRVLATMPFADRSGASRAEAELKRLPKAHKRGFFSTPHPLSLLCVSPDSETV